jgi:PhzF family phenazine biosynthesis protein
MERRFKQVDVFGRRAYTGNPLAVVAEAQGLTDDDMQGLATWTNLSETTFLLPPTHPDADYRVRIFTMARELPFAGHPTLGSCRVWLDEGGLAKGGDVIVQECGVGLVKLRVDGDTLAFEAPPLIRSGPVEPDHLAAILRALGLTEDDVMEAQWVDNGPGWVALLLHDAQAVLDVEVVDYDSYQRDEVFHIGLVGAHQEGSEAAFEVRALFVDAQGAVREDPVTGSLNASLAVWMLGSGLATAPYVASQGTVLGRQGRPVITKDDAGTIWIGGTVFTCIEGTIEV